MMEYYEINDKMRHPKKEVINAFEYVATKMITDEDKQNLMIITEYVEDIANICIELKKKAEDNADLLVQVMNKIATFNQPDPKKQYIQKIKAAYKDKNKKE